MRLSVFYEFKNKEILSTIEKEFNIKVDLPDTPMSNTTPKTLEILESNAKLFYDKNEVDTLEEIVSQLINLGFEIVCREIPYKTTKVIKEQVFDKMETVKCPCGNSYEKPVYREIEKNVVVTKYCTDRIVFKYVIN
jgi:hypothetical protein